MGIGINNLGLIADLNRAGCFLNKRSVLDMGDMDLNVSEEVITALFRSILTNDDREWIKSLRDYLAYPRVSSSKLWKLLEFEIADRLDIQFSKRTTQMCGADNLYRVDLNEKDIDIPRKYDLVTDFGNNEHPFDCVQAYKHMYDLCSENGVLFFSQDVAKGNGFFKFDSSFFESMAAANAMDILYSAYRVNTAFNKGFDVPVEFSVLDLVNFGKVESIGIIYVMRKRHDQPFKTPYQTNGHTVIGRDRDYFYTQFNILDQGWPVRNYLVNGVQSISGKVLLKELCKRIKGKIT